MTAAERAAFRRRLLAWFDAHRRDLPWRENRDPYRIWVSEVMLQQTTVAAVVPHFQRFMAVFPTLSDLAAADEQHVLKHWEGLGYYRRARHLHAAAKQLDGRLPDDPKVWGELPGVGRYILGAVLSQAFDRKLPIVEANSLRVLARLFAYPDDPREGEGKAWVWCAAESLLPKLRVGDFNQALMELGALLCSPTSPKCETCPVARYCQANQRGIQSQIPPPKRTRETIEVHEVAVVIRDSDRVLLCQRPATAKRWQNMWEFPHAELDGSQPAKAAREIARSLAGLRVRIREEILTLRHTVTHHAITMTCFEATCESGQFHSNYYADGRWLPLSELRNHPVSTPQRKLIDFLLKPDRARNLF